MANFNKFTSSGAELTGNAKPEDVAQGKSFYSTDEDTKLVGTLPVRNAGNGQHITVWNGNLYICKISEGIYKYSSSNATSPEVLVPASLLGNATTNDVLKGKTFSSQNGAEITGTLNILENMGFKNIPLGNWTIKTGYLDLNRLDGVNIVPLTVYVEIDWVHYPDTFTTRPITDNLGTRYGSTGVGGNNSEANPRCYCAMVMDLMADNSMNCNNLMRIRTFNGVEKAQIRAWLQKI